MDAAKVLHVFTIVGALLVPVDVVAQTPAWSGSTTAPTAATNYDRYGQPISSGAATISQRTQNGISQTGSAMRDGVEAGIQQANDQISRGASQAWDSNRNSVTGQQSSAAPAFGSTPATTTSPWPTTPTTTSNASGWPNSTAGRGTTAPAAGSVTPVDGGWTSIGTSVPSPPLLVPQSPMQSPTTTNFGNSNGATNRNTPTYPAVAATEQGPLHSVLADPSRNSNSNKPEENWPNSWNNNGSSQPASIGRNSNPSSLGSTVRDPDLVPLPNSNGATAQDTRGPAIGRPNEGFPNAASTNPWNQQEQIAGAPSIGSGNNKTTFAGFGNPSPNNPPNNQMGTGQFAGQSNNQMSSGQMQNGQNGSNYGNSEMNSNWSQSGGNHNANGALQGGRNQSGPNGTEGQPWTLWILGVLALAGSLAANLYLGASYLDARQKYQSLVRKTAETFRRVKSVAA